MEIDLQAPIEYAFGRGEELAKAQAALELEKDKAINAFKVRNDLDAGNGRYVVIEHNGELIHRPVPVKARSHSVRSVDDLIGAYSRWNEDGVIWVEREKVVLVIADADRRDIVTLPLVKAPLFIKVLELQQNYRLSQDDLVRLLRRDFRKAVNAQALMAAVRNIKFRKSETGHANMQHGNESMGRAIEMEVIGADALIDQQILISTPVFANPGEEEDLYTIGIDLEIVVADSQFYVRPFADDVEDAYNAAAAGIVGRIKEALPGAPVFYGTP